MTASPFIGERENLASSEQMLNAPEVPEEVGVSQIEVRVVATRYQFIGRVTPIEQVDLVARVDGFLEELAFEEAQHVTQGAPLFRIERARYATELASAR